METFYSLWIVFAGKIIAGSFLPRGIGFELWRAANRGSTHSYFLFLPEVTWAAASGKGD
jgi:hypothetical protein